MSPEQARVWAARYIDHRKIMFRVAAATLGRHRRIDPEDIVQDAFVSIMKHPPPEPANWEAVLVRATQHRAIDALRRADHRKTTLTGDDADTQNTVDANGDDESPEDEVIRRAYASGRRHELLTALNRLPSQQREVARRRILEGQSVSHIAAELGTSTANISKLFKKALVQLDKLLRSFEVSPQDVDALRPTRPGGGQ